MSWVARVLNLLPSWMLEGERGQYVFAMQELKDEFTARARAALELRFPSRAAAIDGALEKIGQERGIPRGRSETADHFVGRVKRWRYPRGHRVRGNPWALLEQIAEYWGGMHVVTVDHSGNRSTRAPDGTETFQKATVWNWDGLPGWSRFWAILYPNPEVQTIKSWGQLYHAWGNSIAGGRGITLGQQGVTPDDVTALRRLFKPPTRTAVPWKPAFTRIDYFVVVLANRLTNPAVTPGGAWGTVYGRASAPDYIRFWRMR